MDRRADVSGTGVIAAAHKFRFRQAGLRSGPGRIVFGIIAVLLLLAAVGAIFIVRQIIADRTVIGEARVATGPMLFNLTEGGRYPADWRRLNEPSLYLQSREPVGEVLRTIRFSWFRSFHPAMVVRLDWLKTGKVRLTAKQSIGAGGYGPSDIGATLVRVLSQAEIDKLTATLAATGLLDQPPVDRGYIGLDGSDWVIESAKPGEYRFVQRWSPGEHAPSSYRPMQETGLFMLGLTSWSLDPIY
jgi:hypothetical protein